MIHWARPTVQNSSNHYSHFKVVLYFEIWKSSNVRTTRVKIVITTGRVCGSASWINTQLVV